MIKVSSEKWYSAAEVANMLDMHVKTVRALIRMGEIKSQDLPGKYLISESAVNDYITRPRKENRNYQKTVRIELRLPELLIKHIPRGENGIDCKYIANAIESQLRQDGLL
jgi:excisionase family DNA binding protein